MPSRSAPNLFKAAPLPVAALDDAGRLACLRLIRSDNVGPVTFRELINHYGGAELALEALPELARKGGGRRTIRICTRAAALAELAAAEKAGAQPVFTIEPGYPSHLAQIDVPPPLLYVKGDAGLLARPALAIVGSREASAAGLKLTRLFARRLGEAGLVVVSGLARGIDATAHEASLATGTVAVLAGGIDVIYPPEHTELARRIAAQGCLVAEMPPGFVPRGREFPRRNRIISGISAGVLVVEAARRSGTLVTARNAGEQGREVFAVPGHPLDPRAEGTNQLIKTGATLVTAPDDILQALEPSLGYRMAAFRGPPSPMPEPAAPPAPPPLLGDDDRSRLLAALGPAPIDIDAIVRASELPIRAVQVLLMELDLAGRIVRHGSQLVSLAPDDST
ncbi:MAG: DNA-processing protein DprA [Pseudomonadota bacterium]